MKLSTLPLGLLYSSPSAIPWHEVTRPKAIVDMTKKATQESVAVTEDVTKGKSVVDATAEVTPGESADIKEEITYWEYHLVSPCPPFLPSVSA